MFEKLTCSFTVQGDAEDTTAEAILDAICNKLNYECVCCGNDEEVHASIHIDDKWWNVQARYYKSSSHFSIDFKTSVGLYECLYENNRFAYESVVDIKNIERVCENIQDYL